jgi:hypothetical protein
MYGYKFTAAVNPPKHGSPTRGPPGCITRAAAPLAHYPSYYKNHTTI